MLTYSYFPRPPLLPLDKIAEKIKLWSDVDRLDLILTSGGTGFGIRDSTPESVRPLLHREAPGVAQALINEGEALNSASMQLLLFTVLPMSLISRQNKIR